MRARNSPHVADAATTLERDYAAHSITSTSPPRAPRICADSHGIHKPSPEKLASNAPYAWPKRALRQIHTLWQTANAARKHAE
eukprot:3902152-Pleurochrysis_carterae.AAC.3